MTGILASAGTALSPDQMAVAAQATGGLGTAMQLFESHAGMSHRFVVQLDKGKYDLGSWSKVSGLSVRWSKLTYRSGNHSHEHVRPGNRTHEPIKLSRAACADSKTVKKWLAESTKNPKPFSGAVGLTDYLGFSIVTWEFREMFPIAWSVGDFDASASTPIIETLELAHSGFLDDEARLPRFGD